MAHHNQHAHALAEIIDTLETPECHGLLLFSFVPSQQPFGFVVGSWHLKIMKEQEMVFSVFLHSDRKIISFLIILGGWYVFVLLLCLLHDLVVARFIFCDFLFIAALPWFQAVPVMDHLTEQGMHLFVPRTVRFIFNAVLELALDMGKTVLVVRSIIEKSRLMVMNQNSLVCLHRRSLYTFVPLFLRAKYRAFPSGDAHINT